MHTLPQKETFLKNREIRDHFTKIMSNWDLKGWISSINEGIILRKTTLIALSLNMEDDKSRETKERRRLLTPTVITWTERYIKSTIPYN